MRLVLNRAILLSFLVSSGSALVNSNNRGSRTPQCLAPLASVAGADIEQGVEDLGPQVVGSSVFYRGKVNEIDYCIAPADVSLSRAYDRNKEDKTSSNQNTLSLTQSLNNASNRAARRIILARCWPSEEALNLSLRLAAKAEKQAEEEREVSGSTSRCPVPRPILNLLMRKGGDTSGTVAPMPRGRTNEEYVADQIKAFRERYGSLPGYNYAEAYLESILSLATNGEESPKASEVLESGIYDESYKRILSVLKSVGATLETIPGTNRLRIAKDLADKDICLSMMDKIGGKRQPLAAPTQGESKVEDVTSTEDESEFQSDEKDNEGSSGKRKRFKFWMKEYTSNNENEDDPSDEISESKLKKDDLGLVLLSDEEPTMTRQLNSLSNIVQRAMLFGGDQELLVLSETLDTNKEPFVERWYPDTGPPSENLEEESRPGVQYLNALIMLLRRAYDDGVVADLEPSVPLIQSFSNSYERLVATLVELGSGYVRPMMSFDNLRKPRTPKEELGRFALWEAEARAQIGEKQGSYPEDLEGTWEVRDEVGDELIGTSTVIFEADGEVTVEPPLQGLRWRLDPGPTHLDTVNFQVLEEDGTVLQYRGFIDRGARLEARFSKRPIGIRGSVMFQMRDGDNMYQDMLPINYKTGTTKFAMTKQRG